MNRALFFSSIDKTKKILEISPNDNPIFTDVKYFGILECGTKLDYSGRLEDIQDLFEVVVSSHVVEHIPDFIGHLLDVKKLAKLYYVALPDYRYCFDHFRRESTVSEVLESFILKRKNHTPNNIIEHRTLRAHNDPVKHWSGDHGDNLMSGISNLESSYKTAIDQKEYLDTHAWKFCPKNMREILDAINRLNIIKFSYVIHETEKNSFSFFIKIIFLD